MFQRFLGLFLMIHLSQSSLFEKCNELYELNDNNPVTINSQNFSFNERNISSCRFIFTAPVDYVIDLNCTIRMDQLDSSKCPMKRFFISSEGVRELHEAEYFCNQNGTERTIRRRSIMNRIVAAYATQENVTDERFNCTAQRIQSVCDCGWSRKVGKGCKFIFPAARHCSLFVARYFIFSFYCTIFMTQYLLDCCCALQFHSFAHFRREYSAVKMLKCMNSLQ